ncbi:MAG TPA: TonB-dependent receptor [Bacteroidetes bacterium]|nr:TonB-dependent receptor [Bacteroidota bacterium]
MNHSLLLSARFLKKIIVVCSALLVFVLPMNAGQTGKISGKVIDEKTGEPLVGVSLMIQGTKMGAASDFQGDYYINNIAPGTYALVVRSVGYQNTVIKNVIVKIDLTTQIDIKLSSTEVIGQEVVIQAQRPLVQKDLTSSSVTVSSDEIKVMPVENINQIINLQAGVVGGHFRGGRTGEVAYLIDGMPINNPANGYAGFTPENSSIREMEVISGTFNAEYGQAMSGIVNIVTQDGNSEFAGSFSTYMGDHYTSHTDTYLNLDKFDITRSKNFQASLSGPTGIDDRLTFFITGRYINDQGFLYGKRIFNISDNILAVKDIFGTQIRVDPGTVLTNPNFVTDDSGNLYEMIKTGDGAYVPMNPYRKYSLNGKLTYAISEFKFTYGYFWEDNFSKNYDHSYRLAPDGIMSHYSRNTINSFQISHVPSQSTFQTLKFSVNNFRGHGYVFEDPNDPRYVNPSQGSPITNYTFRSGGMNSGRYEANNQSIIGQWSLTSQVSKEHKIGIGVEGRMHQIFNHGTGITTYDIDSAGITLTTLRYPQLGSAGNQMYDKRPREASAYVQDKMEYGSMIINAGVRVDYFNPFSKYLRDLTNPPQEATTDSVRSLYPLQWATAKVQVSPRLGVSFPITDQGIIHFSYGHFFQIPTFENLYNNSDYLVQSGSTLSAQTGNPNLDAQRTTTYELGLQQSLFENIGVDFTVYYRDIRNLLGMEIINTTQGIKYGRFINRDYGSIRGLIFSLDRRFADYFSLRGDYTYQIAEGDASDPLSVFYNNQSNPPVETNKQLVPLNWDQRSTLNLNLTVGEMGNWTVGLIFQYGNGFPYTEDTRASLIRFENGALKPSTHNLDLRAEKNFQFEGVNLSIFMLVYNVLDTKNENNVDAWSGRANIDLTTSQNAQKIVGVNTIAEYQNNPGSFSNPRQVRFGVNLGF